MFKNRHGERQAMYLQHNTEVLSRVIAALGKQELLHISLCVRACISAGAQARWLVRA